MLCRRFALRWSRDFGMLHIICSGPHLPKSKIRNREVHHPDPCHLKPPNFSHKNNQNKTKSAHSNPGPIRVGQQHAYLHKSEHVHEQTLTRMRNIHSASKEQDSYTNTSRLPSYMSCTTLASFGLTLPFNLMPKIPVQEQLFYFQEPGLPPLHDQHMALAESIDITKCRSKCNRATMQSCRDCPKDLSEHTTYMVVLNSVSSGSSPPILGDLWNCTHGKTNWIPRI